MSNETYKRKHCVTLPLMGNPGENVHRRSIGRHCVSWQRGRLQASGALPKFGLEPGHYNASPDLMNVFLSLAKCLCRSLCKKWIVGPQGPGPNCPGPDCLGPNLPRTDDGHRYYHLCVTMSACRPHTIVAPH